MGWYLTVLGISNGLNATRGYDRNGSTLYQKVL
jgi:hypothetical protein